MRIFQFLLFFSLFLPLYSLDFKHTQYRVREGKVIFTSTTSKLVFKGIGKTVNGNVDLKNRKVFISVVLDDFRTGIKNRDDHMKENYLETHLYPKAEFNGSISKMDEKSGEAEATGILSIHGIEKKNTILKGILKENGNGFSLNTGFSLRLNDFNIEIPKLVILELNNEIILDIHLEFEPLTNSPQ